MRGGTTNQIRNVLQSLFSLSLPATRREEHIDIARGWMMILVVMHHAAFLKQPDALSSTCQMLILGVHMPFFFLLNGFLMHMAGSAGKYTFASYTKSRMMRLLVPYFLFELANLVLSFLAMPILHNHLTLAGALECIAGCFNDKEMYSGISGRLWFLPCLFFADLFAFALLKHTSRKSVAFVAALAMSAGSYLLATRYGKQLPMTLDTALMGTCFILLGYVCQESVQAVCRLRGLAWACILAATIAAYLAAVYANPGQILMFRNEYGSYPAAIAGALAGFYATMMMSGRYAGKEGHSWFRRISLWYGKNSLAAYPVHVWAVNIGKYALPQTPPLNLATFAIACLATIPIVNLIRTYAPFMLGNFGKGIR